MGGSRAPDGDRCEAPLEGVRRGGGGEVWAVGRGGGHLTEITECDGPFILRPASGGHGPEEHC